MSDPEQQPTQPLCPAAPTPEITRVRHGLATNSSSSHSMVVLPEGVQVPDEPPSSDGTSPWRYRYDDAFVAASETEKRHYLAGMLVAQAGHLWGRGVQREPDDHDQNRSTFDAAPLDWGDTLSPETTFLPTWMEAEINALCGLPTRTDLRNHWTEDGLQGRPPVRVPRVQGGMGPDPVAWAAILAVALDPSTVLLQPDENLSHPLEDRYPPQELSSAIHRH